MNKFVETLLESTIIQGIVTLALVGSVIFLSVTGQSIPDVIVNSLMIVIGFWFGSKGVQAARSGKV